MSKFTYEDFSFIKFEIERKMISSACMAISEEDWAYLKNTKMDKDGFMFSKDTNIKKIMYKVSDAYNGGYSGCTMGLIMRTLQEIAKYGLEQFKENYLEL